MFQGFKVRGCKSLVGMRTETDYFPDVGVLQTMVIGRVRYGLLQRLR